MFKNLFCRHETIHIANHKKYQSRLYLRQCKKCGKYFVYDKFADRYAKEKNVNWAEWKKAGADNERT